uniref:Uncharacterized protein n=1 Tax=Utricularia reniformis TaxID=192314 RepID=A0A1Y0AYT4_9LAMI|nr:hypothetical protein AEK19_MT0741 [Utricularia reniformis]ART30308.1 hypothetical protein AEK19_MT0741 [Utricularia reniformis]
MREEGVLTPELLGLVWLHLRGLLLMNALFLVCDFRTDSRYTMDPATPSTMSQISWRLCPVPKGCQCKAFMSTLQGPARDRFRNLPEESIGSLEELFACFMAQHAML